ncbi:LPXTG cell wall anchor domain-containing protein [Macrococcus bovicus]|uniref:LPXTG cell wall anchor domain-containing protein n=1 Tax=Macrococcus bovicus TaxID=69968 RepID=A0A4R6BY71_9STAP|nr:LPXTG cell wall anchor domain-containing protein [Macrococcus bovicus]TDM13445.1 LPXTG cell wall anchor domain-containing protein [Macrococcus bovicus]
MRLNKLLIASLTIGTLQLPTITMTAFADEGAKTVTGEILPASTDTDGDGWANVGFDPSGLPAADLEKVNQLTIQKDSGQLSQVEYNEQVAAIFKQTSENQQSVQTQQDQTTITQLPDTGEENRSTGIVVMGILLLAFGLRLITRHA